ncbi:hypothetical protein [Muricoccus radiodurans]|uniref:hypothetical protein n=1 Tax=Muricoccus radiodurans TaxID=2231721 RepID=UPI003CF88527
MRGIIAALVVAGLAGTAGPSLAQPAPAAGRFQVAAAPGAPGAPPTVVMVDTATGQSWVLVQTPGPPVQWAPVRFWTPGSPPALAPLPPGPSEVGTRPAAEGPQPPPQRGR